jgi:Spy/CpxP family protein refolding chaperone
MRKRYWVVPLILVTGMVLGGAGLAQTNAGQAATGRFAQTRIGRLIMGRLGRMLALRSQLNLTPEQKQAVKATLLANRADLKTAVAPVIEKRRALRDAVLSDANDEKAIRAAANDLGKALGDAAVEVNKVKTELKSKAGLTPQQIKLIEDFRAQNDAAADQIINENPQPQ